MVIRSDKKKFIVLQQLKEVRNKHLFKKKKLPKVFTKVCKFTRNTAIAHFHIFWGSIFVCEYHSSIMNSPL